jgi:hypothetical protein
MEILAEIVFSLLAWLAEIALQLLFEVLAEFGVRALGEPFRPTREVSPWVAGLGYAIYGAVAGGISLWLFPAPVLHSPWLRIANLAVAPLAAGAAMSLMGAWRHRRGEALVRLDRFGYGVLFALSMALLRFFFAEDQ